MMTTDDDTSTRGGPNDPGPRVSSEQIRDLSRLRRTSMNRQIAGVAGGLARHFDIDPVVVRVALAVLVLFGGSGLILYVGLWLLVPSDQRADARIPLDERSRGVALLIVGLLAAAALLGHLLNGWVPWPLLAILLIVALVLSHRQRSSGREGYLSGFPVAHPPAEDSPTQDSPAGQPSPASQEAPAWTQPIVDYNPANRFGAPTPPPTRPMRRPDPARRGPLLFWFTVALALLGVGVLAVVDLAGAAVADSAYPALALAIVAGMLVVGAFYGRAGGLIALGVVLAITLAGAVAFERIGADESLIQPKRASEVATAYSFPAGSSVVDLSEVADVEELAGRQVHIEAGMGEVEILLPDDLAVEVEVEVGLGSINLPDDASDGAGIRLDGTYGATPGAAGNADDPLELRVELSLGDVEVRR